MTESKSTLAKALVKFQGDVPVIPKNRTAKIKTKTGMEYSYSYADLADIWEAIRQPLASNGLAVTQFLKSSDTTDFIVTKVWHESGETDSEYFALPTNGKTPQEVGSVITYYKRYTLGAALGISTEEDDDGKSGNKAPVQKEAPEYHISSLQANQIRNLGKKLNLDPVKTDMRIDSLNSSLEAKEAIRVLKQMAEDVDNSGEAF